MPPLASQSSTATVDTIEATSKAAQVTRGDFAQKAPANDNSAAWKPSLLVFRRRRLARRSNRS